MTKLKDKIRIIVIAIIVVTVVNMAYDAWTKHIPGSGSWVLWRAVTIDTMNKIKVDRLRFFEEQVTCEVEASHLRQTYPDHTYECRPRRV